MDLTKDGLFTNPYLDGNPCFEGWFEPHITITKVSLYNSFTFKGITNSKVEPIFIAFPGNISVLCVRRDLLMRVDYAVISAFISGRLARFTSVTSVRINPSSNSV